MNIIQQLYEEAFDEKVLSERPSNIQSLNKVYLLETEHGPRVVKLVRNREEAGMEAAANYHLPRNGFSFIPTGILPLAFEREIDGELCYMIAQEDISRRAGPDMPIGYWLAAATEIHAKAKSILEFGGVGIRQVTIPTGEMYRAKLSQYPDITVNLDLFSVCSDAIRAEQNVFIHQDLRKKNLLGRFMLDFGSSGAGPIGYDLVKLLAYGEHGSMDEEWMQNNVCLYMELASQNNPVNTNSFESLWKNFLMALYVSDARLLIYLRDIGRWNDPEYKMAAKRLNRLEARL